MTLDDLADALARRLIHEDARAIAAIESPRARAVAAEDIKRAILVVAERAATDERERRARIAAGRASRLAVRTESDPSTATEHVTKRRVAAMVAAELRDIAREIRAEAR